jgi:hypothetical protein
MKTGLKLHLIKLITTISGHYNFSAVYALYMHYYFIITSASFLYDHVIIVESIHYVCKFCALIKTLNLHFFDIIST